MVSMRSMLALKDYFNGITSLDLAKDVYSVESLVTNKKGTKNCGITRQFLCLSSHSVTSVGSGLV